ncbi:ABC transporter ATP-binding protein [Natrarchaeobaculum sulfurireducens]|uniref:ABC-type multidrug transport system, ATPase and permease component n=1 Tax=Natrarchaeobaculum sulfurireducens TaxID=2044521 RepID=A0A346PDY7_9EURY|nr:ABC transporter ATP-binding protein [Natrarchaeobaculum sulfurireducens]AXR77732.1 ABC-type multidrug transport system, ATPase and permease component [Natrarchaeobaculum sulfurireducens]
MSPTDTTDDISWREKGQALYRVGKFHPALAVAIVVLSVVAALLEGIGLGFIMPILEVAQGEQSVEDGDAFLEVFFTLYETLGIPFTLGYLVAGVTAVMTVRFTTSFLVNWLSAAIVTKYVRHLQEEAFNHAIEAEVSYFDREGSDDILNAIVTQAEYAGGVIQYALSCVEQGLLAAMYLTIALLISPLLTVLTAVFLGGITVLFRHVLDTGYSLGDKVADAKEGIQSRAQAGTQGVREVKIFGMLDELRSGFSKSVEQFERNSIKIDRNDAAITNFYQLMTAVAVFGLIYAGLTLSSMTLAELGVFLFAMYQLGPKVSTLNKYVYRFESQLPHLVRTQEFLEELEQNREPADGSRPVPKPVNRIEFDDVRFSYDSSDELVLRDVSFEFTREEFVAFVGPSGAGKSTIASLLARLYEPDRGEIRADGIPIDQTDIQEWRSRVAVVRQDPHVFNETLRRNVTAGNRDATQAEVEAACEIAQVTEFLEDLPDGYDTVLGDQGVKLSGGQRQRVAIARALLKDADLLILDEATSDLDTALEQKVHSGIESMDRDYAMLVIAHRLSTVTNADRIYTMEDGRIVEAGPHEELLSNANTYSSLYSLQSQ